MKNWLRKRETEVLGIEFTDKLLKIVVLVDDDEIYAVSTVCTELPEELQEHRYFDMLPQTAQLLKATLAGNNLTAVTGAAFVLQDKDVVYKRIAFPAMSAKELQEAWRWEREQYLQYDSDGYMESIRQEYDGDESRILVRAARKERAAYFTELAQLAGLRLLLLTGNALAADSFLRPDEPDYLLVERRQKDRITVYKGHFPVLTGEAEADCSLKDAAGVYREKYLEDIGGRIYLSGGGSTAEEITGCEVVSFNAVKWDGSFLQGEQLQRMAADYCGVCGAAAAALRGDEINLLCGSDTAADKSRLFKAAAAIAGIMLLLLWGGAYGFFLWQERNLQEQEQKLASLSVWQERYESYRQWEQKTAKLEESLKQTDSRGVRWSRILEIMGSEIPQGCWLNTVSQRQDKGAGQIVLEGKATDIKKLEKFVAALEGHEQIAAVELLNTKNSGDKAGSCLVYTLAVRVKGEDDE